MKRWRTFCTVGVLLLLAAYAIAEQLQFRNDTGSLGDVTSLNPFPVYQESGSSRVTFNSTTFNSAAVSKSVAPGVDFVLHEIRVHHANALSTGTLTVTVNAGDGAVYDTVIDTKDMASTVNYSYQPGRPRYCESGDAIDVSWSPDSATTTGLLVVWEPL